ncbi:MAG: hypothetical protein GXO62_04680 [Epsilonproteobacteria bacterium]|nr:hypothetical protein [Campylobacterota bacterium]
MKIHYAHTAGYTEIQGLESFLKKINNAEYVRIFPTRLKPVKKKKLSGLKKNENGITGKELIKRIKERVKLWDEEIKYLIIMDDGDCRLKNLKFDFSVLDDLNIQKFFLIAEPEIEKWFCIDKSWIQDCECNGKSLYQRLNELIENFNYEYDEEKKSCKIKFSNEFKDVLNLCGFSYSKNADGGKYLAVIDPFIIAKKDEFAKDIYKIQGL